MPSVQHRFSQPVSLEGERRKAMMLVHSVEKDIVQFREKYFRKPRNKFSEDTNDFIAFVLEKTACTRRQPKCFREFAMLMDKTRNGTALLYREEMLLMDIVIARQRCFEDLMNSGIERMDEALGNHVAKFCHSFVSEAEGVDIRCVQEYENNITRWKDSIKDGKSLLADIQRSLTDLGSPFHHFVRNYSKILHYIGLSLEVFPRIYNPLKDWVTADEAYVRKLTDELNLLTSRRSEVTEASRRQQLKADNLHHKFQHQSYQSKRLQSKLYDAMDERKFCRRRELAVIDTYARVVKELEMKQAYLDQTLSKLYLREPNARSMYDRMSSNVTSIQDNIVKLEKRHVVLQKTLDNVRKERYVAQKQVHKLQLLLDKSSRSENLVHTNADTQVAGVKVTQDETRVMGDKIEILKRIKSLKTHPLTLHRLHTAFRLVAPDVGRDWAFLYQTLPFRPSRDFATRTYDIELIDLSAQRHDLCLREIAVKCLERWRRLSHDATIPNLAQALRNIRKRDLAKKLERDVMLTS